MNDRYLFRGKTIDNDNWVIGYYEESGGHSYINYEETIEKHGKSIKVIRSRETIPETVGQCTGRKDENGVLIFENDIVKFRRFGNRHTGKVIFNEKMLRFEFQSPVVQTAVDVVDGVYEERAIYTAVMHTCRDIEIIGNYDDNPELLEVEYAKRIVH